MDFTTIVQGANYSIARCTPLVGETVTANYGDTDDVSGVGFMCWPIIVSGKFEVYGAKGPAINTMGRGELWRRSTDGKVRQRTGTGLARVTEDMVWFSLASLTGANLRFANFDMKAGDTITLEQGDKLFVADGKVEGVTTNKVISKTSPGTVEFLVEEDALVCIFGDK